MKTISTTVIQWLQQKPFIINHMKKGLINHSALARQIQCEVELEIGEKVSREAIAMTLSRYAKSLSSRRMDDASQYVGDITLQTGLSVVNFNADDFYKSVENAVSQLNSLGEFYVLAQGVRQAGLITKTSVLKSLSLEASNIIYVVDNQVGITVRLKAGHEPILGVCAYIVSLVSQNGVNLEEVLSTKDEMTLIVDKKYAKQASEVLLRASQNS